MAPSERELPHGLAQRTLQEHDLDAALALSQEAGWNQIAADWRLFLELGLGIGLVRDAGRLIATAAILPYRRPLRLDQHGPRHRAGAAPGAGQPAPARMRRPPLERRVVPVLDATPAGRAVYGGLDFMIAGACGACSPAWRSTASRARAARPCRARARADGLAAGCRLRRRCLRRGSRRAFRRLARRLPRAALVAERDGRIVGFLLGRDGRVMNQLGPLAAESHEVAMALLAQAVADVPAPLAVDVPDRHAALADWLVGLRLRRRAAVDPDGLWHDCAFDDGARLFAIAGPELG